MFMVDLQYSVFKRFEFTCSKFVLILLNNSNNPSPENNASPRRPKVAKATHALECKLRALHFVYTIWFLRFDMKIRFDCSNSHKFCLFVS
jgi:hypothetical protein